MDDVTFEYHLADGGWADVAFRIGRETTELAVSHAGEPLDRLIEAVLALAAGQGRADVYWRALDDGRQWWSHVRWALQQESGQVNVQVVKVHRGGGGQQGGIQLSGRCSVLALRAAVAEGTNLLYLRTGARRYTELTQAQFPIDGLDRLEMLTQNPAES